jgi:hypothetical protein
MGCNANWHLVRWWLALIILALSELATGLSDRCLYFLVLRVKDHPPDTETKRDVDESPYHDLSMVKTYAYTHT